MAASVITESMVHTITPAQLAELIEGQPVDVIDVRDRAEWDAGHIAGTRVVPLEELRADPDAVLTRSSVIVFVCAKGIRSLQAAKLAERFGYERVYNLDGGTKQWLQAGLPLAVEQLAAA